MAFFYRAGFHGFDKVREVFLFEVAFEGLLGGGKNFLQRVAHALAHGAGGIRFSAGRAEGFTFFNGPVNLGQIDSRRRTAQARSRSCSLARLDEFRPLQREQQSPDDHGIGVDAAGEERGRHAITLLVSKDREHMNSHGKAATGSHNSEDK